MWWSRVPHEYGKMKRMHSNDILHIEFHDSRDYNPNKNEYIWYIKYRLWPNCGKVLKISNVCLITSNPKRRGNPIKLRFKPKSQIRSIGSSTWYPSKKSQNRRRSEQLVSFGKDKWKKKKQQHSEIQGYCLYSQLPVLRAQIKREDSPGRKV